MYGLIPEDTHTHHLKHNTLPRTHLLTPPQAHSHWSLEAWF